MVEVAEGRQLGGQCRSHLDRFRRVLRRPATTRGFDVYIYGEQWSPPSPKAFGEPLAAFLGALPANLRRPAYLALSKALHPDQGGDTEWMKHLNRAMDRHR